MTKLLQVFTNFTPTKFGKIPTNYYPLTRPKTCSFHQNIKLKVRTNYFLRDKKDGIFVNDKGWKSKKRLVLVGGFGLNNGGGGGDNGGNARILGNLALAIGLTYLSMTGQLGGVFDAIGYIVDALVSIWLLAVILPIVGLGAFLWWAGRDIVQSSCPNCGNEFQIFKSSLNDELQLCPYCSQPFSVDGDKFVRESVKFSNESTTFGDIFGNNSPRPKKGKDFSKAIVDVEAEIKDAE